MDEFEKFYLQAIRFLSYRPRSAFEVKENLTKKKASPQIIETVVLRLTQQKFLNDEEFTKWFVMQRIRFAHKSMQLIKLELKQKGISREIIESAFINQESGKETDLEQAKKLVLKKLQKYISFPKQEMYQKLGRVLAAKGFNWDIIKHAIDEVLAKEV